MTKYSLLSGAAAMLLGSLALAMPAEAQKRVQPVESVPYQGVIEVNIDGTRSQLEVQSAAIPRMNSGIMHLGSGEMFYELKGPRSPFRIAQGNKVHFVTRSMGEGADPSMFFKLYRADSKKKNRKIKISTASLSQRMAIDMDRSAVPLRFESGRGSLVRIHPNTPLAPGEYAFLLEGRAFAFGID